MRIILPVCYFGDFELDENNRWTWKWTSDGQRNMPTHITETTSYDELYHDIQKKLNVDLSLYNMVLRYQFQEHLPFSIPPANVTSDIDVSYLYDLNKTQMTPICVTLVMKDDLEGRNEHSDGADDNANNFWDTVEIAREDDTNIPETVVHHHDITKTHIIQSVVQDSENVNEFTNEDLIGLSRQRHEWGGSSGAGTSGPSSNSSRVVPDEEDLYVEQLFETKKALQEAVHLLALKFNFEFKVKKSNKSLLTVVCVDDSCRWRLRGTKMDTNENFVVRKYIREHTCELGIRQNDHRQARSWFIGRQIMHKYQNPRTIYRPSDIINDVRREYGVVMSYQKALKAKECALEDLLGSAEESYAKLARYCHNLGTTNHGSTFFIETEGEKCFKYLFMALGQCIRGFTNAMRPVILVDGTTLKSKYRGTLIIATCQDPNIQIYPLAFGIVDSENDRSMSWFFTKLREVIGEVPHLAFVTDRGQSLINAIAEVFPEAHHGYCMYHIQGNLKTRYRGQGIVSLFRRAAEAYSVEECNKWLVEIGNKSISAWDYLTKMGIEHWARSHFPTRRYNLMTSNNVESMNSLFKKDRELPILALIENIRTKLQQWFHDRRVESQNCSTWLAPAQEEKLFKAAQVARRLNVEPLDESRFSVQDARQLIYIVDLNEHTCTCARFQLESFPCEHAVAVSMNRGFAARTLCSQYYTAEYWRTAYAETIFPLPNESDWEVPDHIFPLNSLSPPVTEPRGPGRPRTSRIPSTGEFSRPRRCDRCRAVGHTRQNCTSQIPLDNN